MNAPTLRLVKAHDSAEEAPTRPSSSLGHCPCPLGTQAQTMMVGLGGLGVGRTCGLGVGRTYVLRPWSLGLEQGSQVCLLVRACVRVCVCVCVAVVVVVVVFVVWVRFFTGE